ncbi:MAG: glycoside hydrolase family 16 protein [Acidimicrobiales bacterium]
MVNIDASSASGYGGRDSTAIREEVVLTLSSNSGNSQFSGLVKRWEPVAVSTSTSTSTTTTTATAPARGGGSGGTGGSGGSGGGSGGGTGGSGGGGTTTTTDPPPTTTTTTTDPPPTTTTTTTDPAPTAYPVGTLDSSMPSGYAPPGANALAGYTQSYVTDFPGTSLPSGWDAYAGNPGGDPGAQWAVNHVVVGGGLLSLNTFQDPAYGGEWVTGGLCQCGQSQTYGAYFVRSRVTGAGPTNVELLWPTENWPPEIDFNETGGDTTQTTATNIWALNSSGSKEQQQDDLTIDMTQWHTWGVIWTPSSITMTVDGQVWGTFTNPSEIPSQPMTLDLQQQTWCSSGWACPTAPESMQINWVAEYTSN